MSRSARRLRTPEERVGNAANASLPPPVADETTDEELLRRALIARDEQAFGRALDRFFPAMLRLALSHVQSRATAEEVIQETWLAALRGIDRFEGRSAVKTWLFHILRNIARGRGRRDARMRPLSDLTPVSPDAEELDPLDMIVDGRTAASGHGHVALWVGGTDPEQELLDRELAERLEGAMALLPPRLREVIVLRDVEGWSADEVCNALEISDTNQRVMLHRARNRVRDEMRPYLSQNGSCT